MKIEAQIIPAEIVKTLQDNKMSPFISGMRVHCPLKDFSPRKIEFCIGCEHFKGLLKRKLKGEYNEKDISIAKKQFSVHCNHPISRSLVFVVED